MAVSITWENEISHVKVDVLVLLAIAIYKDDILKFTTDLLHSLMDILYKI
jgi:hypothetical protein